MRGDFMASPACRTTALLIFHVSMPIDSLKTFARMREKLAADKARIEARLQEINAALGFAYAPRPTPVPRATRSRNSLSLRKAVIQVTTGKPMTKEEILSAVAKLGYRFTAKNPVNSLNVVLYGSKNPKFKNDDGRFSPAS